jgi:hypothetical protein
MIVSDYKISDNLGYFSLYCSGGIFYFFKFSTLNI